jgi:lysophospholipase L1-like esterase
MSETKQNYPLKIKILTIIILNLLVFASLIAFAFYFKNSTNTLENNTRWFSKKVMLEKKVMGAIATMETPRALADNRLDLGVWHGNQEIFLRDVAPYQNLNFKAKLEENSHFSFFYYQRGDTLEGIRISTNPAFPSMAFSVLYGAFIHKQAFDFKAKKNKWMDIQLNKTDLAFQFLINDEEIGVISNPFIREMNAFGLRGSERSAIVDDIFLKSETQQILMQESFQNQLFPPLIIAFMFFSLVLLNVFLCVFRNHYKWLIAATLFVVLFSIGYYLYYQFYQQYRYAAPKKVVKVLPKKEQKPDLEEQYKKNKKNTELRVLFIGTSQTWGAGASSEENTFVDLFETRLNYYLRDTTFVCINAGVEGQTTTEMLDYYRYLQPIIQPDFVILNLGYNDNYEDEPFAKFKKNIQTFIDYSKGVETTILLIPEPSNPDHPNEALNVRVDRTRYLMDSIGNANHVPVLKMHPFIEEHIDDGFLFWDAVHLTDFGQKLFAEELYHQINTLD